MPSALSVRAQAKPADGQIFSTYTQIMRADSQIIPADGQIITTYTQIMRADSQIITTYTQIMGADGQIMTTYTQIMSAERQFSHGSSFTRLAKNLCDDFVGQPIAGSTNSRHERSYLLDQASTLRLYQHSSGAMERSSKANFGSKQWMSRFGREEQNQTSKDTDFSTFPRPHPFGGIRPSSGPCLTAAGVLCLIKDSR